MFQLKENKELEMSAWRNAKEAICLELYQTIVGLPPLKSPERFRSMVLLLLTGVLRDRAANTDRRGCIIRVNDVDSIKLACGLKDISKAKKLLHDLVERGYVARRKTDSGEVYELLFARPLVESIRFHSLKWQDTYNGEETEEA